MLLSVDLVWGDSYRFCADGAAEKPLSLKGSEAVNFNI